MKKVSHIKRSILIFLVCTLAFLPILSACNTESKKTEQENTNNQNDPNENETKSEDSTENAYVFPDVKYSGEKFIILNNAPIWDFTTVIVPAEQIGEVLNDAMWTRNEAINEQFNIKLEELAVDIGDIARRVKTAVQSQTQDFDAVFCPGSAGGNTIGAMVSSGFVNDLTAVPGLNLTSPWWNQTALEDSKIGDNSAVYFAFSDISIHALQCPWVIYFNEKMFQDLGLERPYQLVRDGKWTLDQMQMYMKATVNLNGDDSFIPYNPSSESIYGLSIPIPAIGELLRGSDVSYVGKDSDNMPVFKASEPRFLTAALKIADILSLPGMYTDGGDTHYERVFMNGRSLFCYAEFKAGTVYRNSETHFGIVPTPKLNENQKNYVHNMTQEAPVFIIPTSTPDIGKTAVIMDALAYLSHRDVTPVFFDLTMSEKELRNEESVEMLQIIRDTSIFDIGRIYSWSNDINSAVYNDIIKGGGSLSSIIESNENKINLAIEKTISALQK